MSITTALTTDALHRAYQKKAGQLYDNLFAALAIAGSDSDEVAEAEQAFERGLSLAKESLQKALTIVESN